LFFGCWKLQSESKIFAINIFKSTLMKKRTLGIAMVAIGILMMIYTGFNYVTKEKVVDLGPIEISADKNHPVQWSPIVGLVLLIGGVAILLIPRVKN
jgi:uncharacterized membrane protein YidH (DUF202 family)